MIGVTTLDPRRILGSLTTDAPSRALARIQCVSCPRFFDVQNSGEALDFLGRRCPSCGNRLVAESATA
jgi:hypothetical protein